MKWLALLIVPLIGLLGACSGSDTSTADGGAGGVSGAGGQGGSSPPAAGCPTAAPQEGDSCDDEQLWCSYGDSVDPSCRQVFGCSSGEFKAVTWLGACSQNDACPAAQPAGQSSCNPDEVTSCYYPGTSRCSCDQCEPSSGGPCVPLAEPQWNCSGPIGAACLDQVPNWGTPCSDEGASCQYISCWFATRCEGGVWVWEHLAC